MSKKLMGTTEEENLIQVVPQFHLVIGPETDTTITVFWKSNINLSAGFKRWIDKYIRGYVHNYQLTVERKMTAVEMYTLETNLKNVFLDLADRGKLYVDDEGLWRVRPDWQGSVPRPQGIRL